MNAYVRNTGKPMKAAHLDGGVFDQPPGLSPLSGAAGAIVILSFNGEWFSTAALYDRSSSRLA
jgi:hypothetical protein